MRRDIRHAGLVDGRAIGLVIEIAQIMSEIDQHQAARRSRGTPSRDVSKTDKKHMKGKDQPKGAGKHTSFRTRAPFNREAVPGRQAVQNSNDPVPGREKAQYSDDPVPGRQTAHHVLNPVPGRQTMKDDLVPRHLGRDPLIIDDEEDELTQQSSDQSLSSVWNAGMQVRVVDDELEPEIRCAGWMAVKDDIASLDILAHAVAESESDDGLAMEEPASRARLGRHPEKHHVFRSGEYRNERYEDVTEETPDYYFWGSQERKPSKYLQHYMAWVTEHYVVDPVRSTLTSKATGRILEAKPTKGQKQTESQLKKSLRQEGWKQTAKCVPRVTRATQHELVPLRHTYVSRACNAVLSHKRNVKKHW